jgi:histone deacetylase 6
MIDFEQLKIENQSLNEKIEERNEELLKLRKKTTSTVQVLTHLKEKLQFVQAENQVLKAELTGLEADLGHHRDAVTKVKLQRDQLRQENAKLKARPLNLKPRT